MGGDGECFSIQSELLFLEGHFSALRSVKFRHNFKDCLNPLCSCSLEVETVIHYFLHCHYYNIIRRTLLDTVNEIINKNLSDFSEQTLVNLLLYGNPSLTFE